MYRKLFKPILDIILALLGFICLSPIFVIVSLILFFSNNGKIFFFQSRPGLKGKVFKIIKFKSMNDKKDADGELLPFDQRITKLGNFIRKYSLDEIPQLLNVIKGDMSIIGPRPLLVQYLPLYNDFQKQRHNVKPGITGWAQVNGRNAISWDQKFEYDVWYVKNLSLFTDIKILLLTVKKVIIREGINSSEKVSMTMFTGTK